VRLHGCRIGLRGTADAVKDGGRIFLSRAIENVLLDCVRQVVDLSLDPAQPLLQVRLRHCEFRIPLLKSSQILEKLLAMDAEAAVVVGQTNPWVLLDPPVRVIV
jgi:hypothetical protein